MIVKYPPDPYAVTEADGANVVLGALADAAVVTDASGTLSGKLRGIVKLLLNLTNGTQKTQIVDNLGNDVASITHDSKHWLQVVNLPAGWAISDGSLTGHEVGSSHGFNGTVGTTREDIWAVGGDYVFPTSAITMRLIGAAADAGTLVTSGTATGGTTTTLIDTGKNFIALGVLVGDFVLNDTDVVAGIVVTIDSAIQLTINPQQLLTYSGKAYRVGRVASTGAAVVEVHGLDATYAEISEFVIMNGIAPGVNTTKQYLRRNNTHIMYVGTGRHAAGNIDLQNTAGTVTYDRIELGENGSATCVYTVPLGFNLFMTNWKAGSAGTKTIEFYLESNTDYHDRAYIPAGAMIEHDTLMVAAGTEYGDFEQLPMLFPEKADILVSGNTFSTTGEGNASFRFWLEPI